MKKKIFSIAMSLLFVASAFAFPFRTSCGKVVNVNPEQGTSDAVLKAALAEINELLCDVETSPSQIVINR